MRGKRPMARKNPWRGTDGYWISSDGTFVQVLDHFKEVRGDPKAFGFTEAEARAWDIKDRDRVLTEATRHGFVRVRGHREYTTFDLWKISNRIVSHLKAFVDKVPDLFYPDEEVLIRELSSGKDWKRDMRKLKYLTVERFNEDKA